MALREALTTAMKDAMKAKDAKRLGTVRMILAAIKDKDIAGRTEESREGISDDEILTLLAKLVKQREDSIALYKQGGRQDLVENEEAEIVVIRAFMPKQLDEAETAAAIDAAIAEAGATQLKDMGKVMGALKAKFSGQLDFGKAGGLIKAKLSGK